MSKVKMRCARCGKPFKSSSPKQTLCPECEVKARRERANEKVAVAKSATAPVAAAHTPRIVGPGAAILGGVPTPPAPSTATAGDGARHSERPTHTHEHDGAGHHAHPHREAHGERTGANAAPPRPHAGKSDHTDKQSRASRPATERQPRPEKKPKPAQFELTDEARHAIEARYLELAQPVEFDGIRTQIAGELTVPKHVVKQVVRELRTQRQLPSWWELKSYTGSSSELGRIRELYVPQLPVPPIGVHKLIAEQLGMEPADVYHAIRRIRAEMRLPQYNAPELHEGVTPTPPDSEAVASQESPD